MADVTVDADGAPYLFRCTYCGSAIPRLLTPDELGLSADSAVSIGDMYPYEKCYCGYSRFVICEATAEPGPGRVERPADSSPDEPKPRYTAGKVNTARYAVLPVDQIRPNPKQPRKFFDGEALRGLAESIRAVGLLEDILVRPVDDGYEIVLGERRWRATQLAGSATISAKIVDLSDEETASIAITENVHREDMTEVEEAFAFKSYIDAGGQISTVGRDFGGMEERIAERLRLLNSHHFVEYQQQRIAELTETVASLRAQRQRPGATRYEARIVVEDELLSALKDGFEVAATLADGRVAVRRQLS